MHDLITFGLGLGLGATGATTWLTRRAAPKSAKTQAAQTLTGAVAGPGAQALPKLWDVLGRAQDGLLQLHRAPSPGASPKAQALAQAQSVAKAGSAVPVDNLVDQARRLQESIEQLESFAGTTLSSNEQLRDTLTLLTTAANTVDARLGAVAPLFNEAALLSTAVTDHLQALNETSKTALVRSGAAQSEWQGSQDLLGHFGDALAVMQGCVTHVQDVANKAKLLSLNAAIVASQSQEHGQGFSVVAEQIKTVAQRTQEASQAMQQGLDAVKAFRADFALLVDQFGEALAAGRGDHSALQQLAQGALTSNAGLGQMLTQRAQAAGSTDSAVAKMHEASATLVGELINLNSALRITGKDTRRAQALVVQLVADLGGWAGPKMESDARAHSELQAAADLCQQWQAHHAQMATRLSEAAQLLGKAKEHASLLAGQPIAPLPASMLEGPQAS